MSRSYKKTPYAGWKKCKFSKTYSNRKIRKTEETRTKIADGNSFKKILDSYDICEYKNIETWKEFKQRIQRYYSNYHNQSDKYAWKYYCQRYKLPLNTIDWSKLQWVWRKMYKTK